MSALPPKADMCDATADVCFEPKADIELMWPMTAIATAAVHAKTKALMTHLCLFLRLATRKSAKGHKRTYIASPKCASEPR
jgi:hypothetical protein